MQEQEAIRFLKQQRVVAIIRGDFSRDHLTMILDVLAEENIRILEITLNTTGALEAIRAARQRLGDRCAIGAGTVRSVEQFDAAIEAGAQFTVAPGFSLATVQHAQAAGVLHLPGVATATEAETAFNAGCRVLKLFPAELLGGPAYLKTLRAPLDDIDFMPTGGIEPETMTAYLKAGAVAVGAGSSLVSKDVSEDELRLRARRFIAAAQPESA